MPKACRNSGNRCRAEARDEAALWVRGVATAASGAPGASGGDGAVGGQPQADFNGQVPSMPRIKLTRSPQDALPNTKSDKVYWDAVSPGFGVKVTPKGRKVFIVLYRTGGAGSKLRKYTIGPDGRVTLHQAAWRRRRCSQRSSKGGIRHPRSAKPSGEL